MTSRLVQLEVEDLAFDGKAVSHLDGKVIFLKGGLPGELVEAEIFRSKPRYEEGVVRQILRRSPDRIPARCPHFEHCGGCTWQDLAYPQQLTFKKKQVADCLSHLGGLDAVPVADVLGSAEQFAYRNKMEFSFHIALDSDFTLGLHRRGRFDDIFELERCDLQSETANAIVRSVQRYVRQHGLPVYDVKFHRGYLRFLVIREMARSGQLMVNVVTNYGPFPEPEQFVAQLLEVAPGITTILHNQNGQKSNIANGEIEAILFGPGFIEEQLLESRFRIHANSFFQTNSRQAENLYRTAFDLAEVTAGDRVLDLYCGTGTIGILMAPRVKQVLGVELVEAAIVAARENASLNGVENIEFLHGDVTAFLRSEGMQQSPFDLIVVDPPRAGLHPKALKRLIEIAPPKLLYISCNPATFARDAKALVAAGYELPGVKPVDMFPHTMHIELVGRFHRR